MLIVALLVAVLGSAMVFLYVQSADTRAQEKQEPVEVLKAVAQIEPGESLTKAQTAGKLEVASVPREQVLEGAMTTIGESGNLVALMRVFPNEQITTSKFGAAGEADSLSLPEGQFAISVSVPQTGRVAGFVTPGSNVAVFWTGEFVPSGQPGTRLVLPKVQVIAVAQTTMAAQTEPVQNGQPAEVVAADLITVAVDQAQAEKLIFASSNGQLSFGLLNDKSVVKPGPGTTQLNLFG